MIAVDILDLTLHSPETLYPPTAPYSSIMDYDTHSPLLVHDIVIAPLWETHIAEQLNRWRSRPISLRYDKIAYHSVAERGGSGNGKWSGAGPKIGWARAGHEKKTRWSGSGNLAEREQSRLSRSQSAQT